MVNEITLGFFFLHDKNLDVTKARALARSPTPTARAHIEAYGPRSGFADLALAIRKAVSGDMR